MVNAAPYKSSWYWPLSKRLRKTEYKDSPTIKIAHIDTGISKHPSLIGGFNVEESMDFFREEGAREGKGVICWSEPLPYFMSHGTSTGGLIIGSPSDTLPFHGMVPRGVVELIPCRVTNSVLLSPGDIRRLAEAINWAINQNIKVISISLGAIAFESDPVLRPLTRSIKYAYEQGVIVCCASGQFVTGMVWPAAYSAKGWCICCGPSDKKRSPSLQSAWWAFPENYVTIAAPGEEMPLAYWEDNICSSGIAKLGCSEGSSYSTAYTASIAALWWAKNYTYLNNFDKKSIVPLFRSILQQTCFPWNEWVGIGNCGPGIIDPNGVLGFSLS